MAGHAPHLPDLPRMPEGAVCRACFTRRYPTALPVEGSKMRFEAVAG